MPRTQLIWSQVLPRTVWGFSTDNNAMERTRRRLNSSMGSYMFNNGGGYIRYPDIKKTEQFFLSDGVHLTGLGNEVLLNTLQSALEKFIISESGGISYP